MKDNRIEWLAVLQGYSMLLVVLGHVTLSDIFMDEKFPFIAVMERIIYTFHMPLFVFISGWLFCLTCINRDNTYRTIMRKKLKRLGIPFVAFSLITIVIKLLLSSYVKRQVDIHEIINTFILFSSNPLGEMWFIIVIFILMSLYPIYMWLMHNNNLLLGLCGALFLFIAIPENIAYFQLSNVVRFSVYFICGIMCCHYNLIERFASKWYVVAISLILFTCVNVFELVTTILHPKILYVIGSISGITLSICLCCYLTSINPKTFNSFNRYTFQIFLLGIFFQIGIRIIYGKTCNLNDTLIYPSLFAVSVVTGIYIPVIISKVVEKKIPKIRPLLGL